MQNGHNFKSEIEATVHSLCKTIQRLNDEDSLQSLSQLSDLVQSTAKLIEVSRSYLT